MSKIGDTLKRLREENGLTGKEATEKLRELGIDISAKTLYGYESGRNSTNADMFLALCQIYKCQNIMEVFSDSVDDVLFTNKEWNIIEKYRDLDNHGKEIVDYILLKEQERSKQLREDSMYNFKPDPLVMVAESTTNYGVKEDPDPSIIQPHTIAAHFDGDELTTDELEEIAEFEKIVKNRKK